MPKDLLNKPGKKDLRKEVAHQLEQSLGKLKEQLGEKKFNSRLKKAVKLLTEDLEQGQKEKPGKISAQKVSVDTSIAKELKKTDKVLKAVIDPKKAVAKKAKTKAKPESKAK